MAWCLEAAGSSIGGGDPQDFEELERELQMATNAFQRLRYIHKYRHRIVAILQEALKNNTQASWTEKEYGAIKVIAEMLK